MLKARSVSVSGAMSGSEFGETLHLYAQVAAAVSGQKWRAGWPVGGWLSERANRLALASSSLELYPLPPPPSLARRAGAQSQVKPTEPNAHCA